MKPFLFEKTPIAQFIKQIDLEKLYENTQDFLNLGHILTNNLVINHVGDEFI